MITANIDVEGGIVNGTRGVVAEFIDNIPIVELLNGRKIPINSYKFPTEHPYVFIEQLPLKHAWAITIHKTQGQTIDLAEIDIGCSIFEYGQAYVALSRVKNINSLYIKRYMRSSIKAHPMVKSFYNAIHKK